MVTGLSVTLAVLVSGPGDVLVPFLPTGQSVCSLLSVSS